MDEKLIYLQLGALLHDIGKIVRRAGLDSKEHSEAGSNYLKDNNLLDDKYKDIDSMLLLGEVEKIIAENKIVLTS